MNLGGAELLILAAIFAFTILPLWGIVDAALRPDSAWLAVGNSKIAWIVVQFLLGGFGAIAYFLAVRPKLIAAGSRPPESP